MSILRKVSIYQQARDKIETDISGITQCLNQKKESLFREITVLENEFRSKQQQKLNNVKKLESRKVRTKELQTGIDKLRLEANSLTVDYTIQIDWENKLNVVREMIREFSIRIVSNTVSYASFLKNVPPTKKPKKKKSKQTGVGRAVSQNSKTKSTNQNQIKDYWEDYDIKDDYLEEFDLEDDHWGDYYIKIRKSKRGYDYWGDD